jgi:hypothetical protein
MYFIIPEPYWEATALFVSDFADGVAAWNALKSGSPALQATAIGSTDGEPDALNIAFTGNDWSVNQFGGAYFQAMKHFNGDVALPGLCKLGLAGLRNRALRAAMFYAQLPAHVNPSSSSCQLADQDQVPVPPTDASLLCPRNTGCSACNAATKSDGSKACVFRKFRNNGVNYGSCLPRRTHGHNLWGGITSCSGSNGALSFPVLSVSALNNLVHAENNKCTVSAITATTPATDIYVAATISWSFTGRYDPGCWDIIQDIMDEQYFGIRPTSSVAL